MRKVRSSRKEGIENYTRLLERIEKTGKRKIWYWKSCKYKGKGRMKTEKDCEQKMKGKKQRLKLESGLLKCGLRKS